VAEILAVGLQGQRTIAARCDAVLVVQRGDLCRRALARDDVAHERRNHVRPDPLGSDSIEPGFEPRLWNDVKRNGAEIRVRVGVRDEEESDSAEPVDLEHGIESPTVFGNEPPECREKGGVAGTAVTRALRFDSSHELGVEEEPGAEEESPAVDSTHGDCPRASLFERRAELFGGAEWVA